MSHGGQARIRATTALTASVAGEVHVEEYAYGLGPPTGILMLRYPPSGPVVDFPESRNDFVHQLFHSPDGLLAVRRGSTTGFLGPDQVLWVRRGASVELAALGRQTVLRVCLRQVPEHLERHAASRHRLAGDAAEALLSLARPGTSEEVGLDARRRLLDGLRQPEEVAHRPVRDGPARVVAGALVRDLADPTDLDTWAARLHVSTKTLQRDFRREFAMPFSAWRTRLRLHASLAMLQRWTVTETAQRVGYATASAYVAAFTREYGEPPLRHMSRLLDPAR